MPDDAQLLEIADENVGEVHLSLLAAGGRQRLWALLTSAEGLLTWIGRLTRAPLGAGAEFELWHEETLTSSHVVERCSPPAITYDGEFNER